MVSSAAGARVSAGASAGASVIWATGAAVVSSAAGAGVSTGASAGASVIWAAGAAPVSSAAGAEASVASAGAARDSASSSASAICIIRLKVLFIALTSCKNCHAYRFQSKFSMLF